MPSDEIHPLDRHLFYGQQSLWPSTCERLRIEVGHRSDTNAFLLVVETHEMPSRRQLRLELSGGTCEPEQVAELCDFIFGTSEDWIHHRQGLPRPQDPF